MSEVKRYDPSEGGGVEEVDGIGMYVSATDFDDAQSELSALREELAQTKDVLAIANETLGQFVDDSRISQQRLAASEQRNAILSKAATEFMEYAESGWDHFPDVGVNLRAALSQPTESGASE